jgi:hypothetical protein
VKRNAIVAISEHKLKANRENSKKSTGPKTLRGKAYSRRNAFKHGLFERQLMDFIAHGEDPREWEELLDGLWQHYQPVGKAEEAEVERVAACWWKFKRLWRYENATNRVALRDLGRTEIKQQEAYCKTLEEQEKAVTLQLQGAMKEIEASGEVSQQLQQTMFATMPGLEAIWQSIDESGPEVLSDVMPKNVLGSNVPDALAMAIVGLCFLQQLKHMREKSVTEIALAQHVIPNQEVLDKIVRYDTTIERSLTRALDRLERLQRRRKGELCPPTLKVDLSR